MKVEKNLGRNLVADIRRFWGLEQALEESWVEKGCCGVYCKGKYGPDLEVQGVWDCTAGA